MLTLTRSWRKKEEPPEIDRADWGEAASSRARREGKDGGAGGSSAGSQKPAKGKKRTQPPSILSEGTLAPGALTGGGG